MGISTELFLALAWAFSGVVRDWIYISLFSALLFLARELPAERQQGWAMFVYKDIFDLWLGRVGGLGYGIYG